MAAPDERSRKNKVGWFRSQLSDRGKDDGQGSVHDQEAPSGEPYSGLIETGKKAVAGGGVSIGGSLTESIKAADIDLIKRARKEYYLHNRVVPHWEPRELEDIEGEFFRQLALLLLNGHRGISPREVRVSVDGVEEITYRFANIELQRASEIHWEISRDYPTDTLTVTIRRPLMRESEPELVPKPEVEDDIVVPKRRVMGGEKRERTTRGRRKASPDDS